MIKRRVIEQIVTTLGLFNNKGSAIYGLSLGVLTSVLAYTLDPHIKNLSLEEKMLNGIYFSSLSTLAGAIFGKVNSKFLYEPLRKHYNLEKRNFKESFRYLIYWQSYYPN